MKFLLCATCCLAFAWIPAHAQNTGTADRPAMSSKGAMAEKGAMNGKGAMTDQQFIDMAAQTDMVEANLGQLAQTASSSDQVKQYAQMLVTDHTADYQQLKAMAQQANLTVPDAIDAEHYKTMIAPFQKLKGAAFDHKYAQEMVAGHTKAIEAYKKEAADAQNPAVKSYAASAEPVLEKHLSDAKNLNKPAAAGSK